MFAITHKKIFFALSSALVAFSVFAIAFWGLNFGIEFTGGAILEASYTDTRPELSGLREELSEALSGDVLLQPTGERGVIVRTQASEEGLRETVLSVLSADGERLVSEKRFSQLGPAIGDELKTKALIAIGLVVLAIILYVAFAFRGAGEGAVSAWYYGGIAIVALAHDVIIPTGLFAFLGSFLVDAQIDVLFVTALLAILGYSVNDTIVVFDRVRENLKRATDEGRVPDVPNTVGESIQQTFVRSINTSLTTLLVLGTLYVLGGTAVENFALVMIIGVAAGTYSSLFLAGPLLAVLGARASEKKAS